MGYRLADGAGVCAVGPAAGVELEGLDAGAVGRSAVADEGSPGWLAAVDGGVFGVPDLKCADVGDGENIAGTDDPVPLVHAETVAETRAIKVAQLTTVSLAPPAVPGVVMRTFILNIRLRV